MADTIQIGQRVALVVDLTRYHQKLVIGLKGTLIDVKAGKSPWAGDPRFGYVLFDSAGAWDVLWNGLLPVPADLDALEDAQLLAEVRRRGLLGCPVPPKTETEACLHFMIDYLGPDLWEDLYAKFKQRKT